MPELNNWTNKIICGDTLTMLGGMPDELVSCCMFSPPYWALRDYKVEGQIGLEKTFNKWLTNLWAVMDKIKRVLRKDGTVWVNLGDKHGGSGMGVSYAGQSKGPRSILTHLDHIPAIGHLRGKTSKSLLMLPERFALGCIERGWILRNKLVWQKPNPIPSSNPDSFAPTWEYLFFFVKNVKPLFFFNKVTRKMVTRKPKKHKLQINRDWRWKDEHKIKKVTLWRSEDYFFDLDSVRRKYAQSPNRWGGQIPKAKGQSLWDSETGQELYRERDMRPHPAGANPGDIITDPTDFWTIPTEPSKLAHYASYPKKLCETPLKAGCPRWICKQCGMARMRITKTEHTESTTTAFDLKYVHYRQWGGGRYNTKHYTLGWSFCSCLCPVCGKADCKCGAKWKPGIVLDPFVGTGTTCKVAKKLGLDYIGIDLKQEYCKMAEKEIKRVVYQEELF